jgi:phage shock protein A
MKREDLEKLGITDKDQLDKIMALHGQSVESNKTKVATMQTELDGLKTQLTDANNQIKSYKDMNIDDIKKAASDWEAKAKEAETNAQKQIAELKFNTALALYLIKTG